MTNDDNRTVNVPVIPVGLTADGGTMAGATPLATLAKSHRLTVPGYEILDELGRGGMGVVYRAVQESLGRDIALKFLREEYHPTSKSAARFLEEARITAQLQHPGIPAVHEVGSLADGRPYLAMKLIQGRTLESMLKLEGPHPSRWLSIFEGICQAVGFAHSRSVIHRDLKPANVMVGAFGEVQVMDWGLAKVLGAAPRPETENRGETMAHVPSSLSQSGVETQAGALLGTPAFMAPEQAVGAVDQVDCRSDVFGLGAVLCALLTGHPPYVNRTVETTRQMAATVDQAEANTRIDASGAAPEIIALCKRCLAGDAKDRPATAAELADEVAKLRREADERVVAVEREKAEAAVKAAEQRKRRRLLVIAACGIVLVSAAGTIVSLIQANFAKEARGEALVDRDKARVAEKKAKEGEQAERLAREEAETVSKFMQDVFAQGSATGQASDKRKVNRNLTVKAAMDFAAQGIEGRFNSSPGIESAIRNTVGKTYYELGAYREAVVHFERALVLSEAANGPDGLETLKCVNNLANALQQLNDFTRAEKLFQRVLETCQRTQVPTSPITFLAMNNLAMLSMDQRDYDRAVQMLSELHAKAVAANGANDAFALLFASNLGTVLVEKGDYKTAEPLLKSTFELRMKANGLEHPETIRSLNNLASLYEARHDLDEAEKLFRKALAACEVSLGPDDPTTLLLVHNLAYDLELAGRLDDAEALYRRALAGRVKKHGDIHNDTLSTLGKLANLHVLKNEPAKAEPMYRKLLEIADRYFDPEHRSTLELASRLADVCETLGKTDEAKALRLRAKGTAKEPR